MGVFDTSIDDLWWMKPEKSDLPQIASAAFTSSFNAAQNRRQEQEQFERMMPLKIQQAELQKKLGDAELAGQLLDNQFKADSATDRTALKSAMMAFMKGDTSFNPSFLTPQAQSQWKEWKANTELGKKIIEANTLFKSSLTKLDGPGIDAALKALGNSPIPTSEAWAEVGRQQDRIRSEKAPIGGPSEITKLYNDLANARKAGNNELAKALEQEILSKGGKDLSQTESDRVGSLSQAEKDLNRIEQIFSEIDSTFTGPVAGRVRGLVSGYDEKAAILDQAINAATPNLARGVFREVGVLTDEDIKRYKTQFPTLKDTPEIRKAKIDGLRKRLEEGKAGTMEQLEKSGRNVSGFSGDKAPQGVGGYVPNRKYGGKTYLGGDPNNPKSWSQ